MPEFEALFGTRKLDQYSLEEAVAAQYRIVDFIQKHFGSDLMSKGGDYGQVNAPGMKLGGTRPDATQRVEQVLADIFGAEDCAMVWGAGTGAIQLSLMLAAKRFNKILIHDAPIYKTTEQTMEALKFNLVKADFDDFDAVTASLQSDVEAVYIQHIPQKPGERFDLAAIILKIKSIRPDIPIFVDDNYAVFRSKKIGREMGADVSIFSFFKLLGPEGVGCILGSRQWISEVRKFISSAGCQIQGPLALEALRSIIFAPLALAIQRDTVYETAARINRLVQEGKAPWANFIDRAGGVYASHLNIVIQFKMPIAGQFLEMAWAAGAGSYPVGEESKYDILPMFYRISSNFLKYDPNLEAYTVRINPFRSGPDTILNIIERSLTLVHK